MKNGTVIRLPCNKVAMACQQAMDELKKGWNRKYEELMKVELQRPVIKGFWAKFWATDEEKQGPAKTREEAWARINKAPDYGYAPADSVSRWEYKEWSRLKDLRDAASMGADTIDVSTDDISLFHKFYDSKPFR